MHETVFLHATFSKRSTTFRTYETWLTCGRYMEHCSPLHREHVFNLNINRYFDRQFTNFNSNEMNANECPWYENRWTILLWKLFSFVSFACAIINFSFFVTLEINTVSLSLQYKSSASGVTKVTETASNYIVRKHGHLIVWTTIAIIWKHQSFWFEVLIQFRLEEWVCRRSTMQLYQTVAGVGWLYLALQ